MSIEPTALLGCLIIGVAAGAGGLWLYLRARWRQDIESTANTQLELAKVTERARLLESEIVRWQTRQEEAQQELKEVRDKQVAAQTALEAERRHSTEKLALLEEAKTKLSDQFKALAAEILEDKSKRFTELNKENMGQILNPLKEKLGEFQGKVEELYDKEGKDRNQLVGQVDNLMKLNQQLSRNAENLTRALKGSNKTQGNWGEMILENILQSSGLEKDREYCVQASHTLADGTRAQPDVVINLPENRHLIVDAKVSLTDYERYVSAEDENERASAVAGHVASIHAHINGLSAKNYQERYQLPAIDFVILFVPIEPAFMLAIGHDEKLWQYAWQRNILLVSPSTLLFVLRTVHYLWKQEKQNKNVQEIADRGKALYEKLVGFVEDLQKLGTELNQAQRAYESTMNKLKTGRGNLIVQAEKLKELGVGPTKSLPQDIVESAVCEEHA